MRGRKKTRVITDWRGLQDALTAFLDASDHGTYMTMTVEWKSEGRAKDVKVAYAPVDGLGQVAFITAPVSGGAHISSDEPEDEDLLRFGDMSDEGAAGAPTPDLLTRAMEQSSRLLTGGICVDSGMVALRTTIAYEGMPFSDIESTIRQLAASADEFDANGLQATPDSEEDSERDSA